MSKIGQKPVELGTVQASLVDGTITITGTKGSLSFQVPSEVDVKIDGGMIVVTPTGSTSQHRAVHGLFRSTLANAVVGVSTGWTKRLEIVGTGFNVKTQGQSIVLKVGYSHTVTYGPIAGIQLSNDGNTIIVVSGANKELVGQVAQQIISVRPPDAYKGKGIRHEGARVRIKAGKKAKAA